MYLRVHVPDSDSELLRFLWFCHDDLEGDVSVWKMRSHVFGAVSSSSIASLALGCCAAEGSELYPESSRVLMRDSYVDDVATATESVESAVKLGHELKALCATGAFNLRKFASNSPDFLKEIPVEDRGKNVKNLDLEKDRMGAERTLGLKWEVEGDSFCFEFKEGGKPATRRGVLSTVSSIFDPLGIIAPVTLRGKVLLQRLCAASCGWDDVIPPPLLQEWESWIEEARKLDSVRLSRDISGLPGNVVSTELHLFADASETAHAAVAYVRRVIDVQRQRKVSVSFVLGKSRLNPLRLVQTIPRLELSSAALAVKVKQVVVSELDMSFDRVRFWTDSMIVLSSIRNRTTRFKTFVANRLSFIHSASEGSDWGYVPSRCNPADIGSRGADPNGLRLWLDGPGFLFQEEENWPLEPVAGEKMPECEVKGSQVCQTNVTLAQESPSEALVTHYSCFKRLKKAVAWYHRLADVIRSGDFRRFCLARRRGLRPRKVEWRTELEVSDLDRAERAVLRHVQADLGLPTSRLADGPAVVKKSSQLASLKPLMRDGLLVVGGRLETSPSMSDEAKHPVIVPRGHHVARLLMREAHLAVGHQGREHTLWRLRERFWVIGAGMDVRKMVKSCVVCRKVNGRPQEQQMADLPEGRVTAGGSAFERVGLDVFGPIVVKAGRGERVRYGLMCTCMVTRAVHVELLDSLKTDSLINAIRRIVARRGPIREVVSDMGTNLVGAERELREALSGLDRNGLRAFALDQGIRWRFNPPTGSHFGGFFERQIRTFRKIWRSMPRQHVDEETLHTLFCEIEAIMNDRPLCYVSTGSIGPEPITPAHLLLLRGGAVSPPGVVYGADAFSRRRWRQVQYLASQFWLRFVREFLPTLQSRQKWSHESKNLEEGDVVLLVDKDAPRGQWQMGKVVEAFSSRDGLVRKVLVKTRTSTYVRPVDKLVLVHSEKDLDW